MKCLITGVNGVVGKNLSYLLSSQYYFDIWGCGRSISEDSKYINIDLTDRKAVMDMFSQKRFDYVIHCAANINNEQPFLVINNNLTSTQNVAEASVQSGVRHLFHTSSLPIIGQIEELPITEEHPNSPNTAYHFSKLQSEKIIEHYCKGKINFINMRIPSPVGKGMPLRSIFPIFLQKIAMDEDVTLTGDAGHKQNYLDVRDLASFIYKASLVDGISGLFNVAAEKSYSNLELAETIIEKTRSNSKILNYTVVSNSKLLSWDVSTQKAKACFGYVAEYTLNDTIDWVV